MKAIKILRGPLAWEVELSGKGWPVEHPTWWGFSTHQEAIDFVTKVLEGWSANRDQYEAEELK